MVIRHLKSNEVSLLDEFLYQAIFIPEGAVPPPREIIRQPELQLYVEDFGMKKGDLCLVAEIERQIVGTVWTRIIKDYGHIDDKTPSLAISILPDYRAKGIGTSLMTAMLSLLREKGFYSVSLSVQKANYAFRLYQNLGFEIIKETEEEYIMLNLLHISK